MKLWKGNGNTTTLLLFSQKRLEIVHQERRGQVKIIVMEHFNDILFHKSGHTRQAAYQPTNQPTKRTCKASQNTSGVMQFFSTHYVDNYKNQWISSRRENWIIPRNAENINQDLFALLSLDSVLTPFPIYIFTPIMVKESYFSPMMMPLGRLRLAALSVYTVYRETE